MKKKILTLRAQGKLYKDIAEEVGCSKATVSYYCGKGQKEMNTKRARKRRSDYRQWLTDLKMSLKCIKCGESRHWVLEFHHRDPSKKEGSISRLLRGGSKKKVLEEIKKCDVLCANCHRTRHAKIEGW